MQANHNTPCPDRQPTPAAYLAAMIDRKARHYCQPHRATKQNPEATGARDKVSASSVLVWIEGDAELVLDAAGGRTRRMILAALGSSQCTMDEALFISYPIDTDDDDQHLQGVCSVLEGRGWTVLASRRATTTAGHVNIAMLVGSASRGMQQRLWLAEPVGTP